MPSVEFSDSYRIQSFGYPTNYIRVHYAEVEYDVANNRTKVRLDGVYIKYTGGNANSRCYGTLKFNGTTMLTMDGSPYTVTVSTGYTYIPGTENGATVWISHNEVGAATLTITLSGGTRNDDNDDVFGALYYYGSGYPVIGVRTPASKSVALTTHPRASTIASSSTSVATQGTYSLTMNRMSSSYYHIATFLYNNSTTLYTSGRFDTQLDFVVPRSWFADYPSIASLPVTVSVQTYNSSGTAIGSPATASLTVNADADMKPVVSSGWASLAPYNTGAVSGITGYVKGYSKAEAAFDDTKVDMSNAVGAGIVSFSVTCQGETDSYTPYLTPVLASTSVSVVCAVTDTRGRTASETFTLTVMDYAKPVLTGIEIFRCDAQGTEAEDGTHYSVKATLTYSSLDGQNVPTLTSAAAASGGGYGAEETLTSGTVHISTAQISADATYTVRISATDSLGNTAVYYQVLPTRKWAMKFRPTGNGVAFGKAAEYNNTFEITEDWSIRVAGKAASEFIRDIVYPVGSIYMSVNSVSPATLLGGTWEQLEDRFLLAAGSEYAAGTTGGKSSYVAADMPKHSHTRDTMNITGQWRINADNSNAGMDAQCSGSGAISAFQVTGAGCYGDGKGWSLAGGFNFNAENAWTGSTSEVGTNDTATIMPPYLAVYMWKRTG